MSMQMNKVLVIIMLLGSIFLSYSGNAGLFNSELQESVRSFFTSLPHDMDSLSPAAIIGICIMIVLLAIIFRGLIFFIVVCCTLAIMFGGTEKVISYLKEKFEGKFDFVKNIDLKSSTVTPKKGESDEDKDKADH
ncbi:Hypothetical protein CINCED_3A024584 [Cinara cedri]|uniref:Uncharacterized protein n=1 Tax=Cinara cedri TaxID=506608 RepID=A0A5E4NRH2_9HEMI|nr:Hypothetical protein CINCED_3A024584 [Cinara cedri]